MSLASLELQQLVQPVPADMYPLWSYLPLFSAPGQVGCTAGVQAVAAAAAGY